MFQMVDYELRHGTAAASSKSAGVLLERVDGLRQRCADELVESQYRAARFG